MDKKRGLCIIGFQGRDYVIYVTEHKHTYGTKLLVRATEQNNYTKSSLILGKVEFQKELSQTISCKFCLYMINYVIH